MQPIAGVAEVDQMRAGIGERDHARRMLQQGRDARVVVLVELGDQLHVERQIEHIVERILALAFRQLRDRDPIALDLAPVAVEEDALLRVREVVAQALSNSLLRYMPAFCAGGAALTASKASCEYIRYGSPSVKSNESGWQLAWMYTSCPRAMACAH